MNLSEIEESLVHGKCTPELFMQFKTALRRSPASMRPQHCYTTAAAMPQRCFSAAKELIAYSLTLEGTWLDRMRAHSNLADLYEKQRDYLNAKAHYQLALDAVPAEQQERYAPDTASRMLVCQLHLDGFVYSDDLRCLYAQAQKLDEFNRSFLKCQLYLSLAQIILSMQDGDIPAAQVAYSQAYDILRPGHEGPLTTMLKRKGYSESTGVTREARAFLKQVKKYLH